MKIQMPKAAGPDVKWTLLMSLTIRWSIMSMTYERNGATRVEVAFLSAKSSVNMMVWFAMCHCFLTLYRLNTPLHLFMLSPSVHEHR